MLIVTKLKQTTPFRTRFTETGKKVGQVIKGVSCTLQEFKNECDINHILYMYKVKGVLPPVAPVAPTYEDVTGCASDYMSAMQIVMDAKEQFEALPSQVRKEVGNSPLGMLEWLQDPNNQKRGVELGFFEKVSIPAPVASDPLPTPDIGSNPVGIDSSIIE